VSAIDGRVLEWRPSRRGPQSSQLTNSRALDDEPSAAGGSAGVVGGGGGGGCSFSCCCCCSIRRTRVDGDGVGGTSSVLKRTSLSGRPLPSFDDPLPAAPIDDSEASTTPSTSFDARRKDRDGRELQIHIASDRPSGAWPSLVARERALKLLGRIEAGKLALGHDARARAVGLAHAVRRANVVCARRIERQPVEKETSTVRSARS
jgi:hypothetical protein